MASIFDQARQTLKNLQNKATPIVGNVVHNLQQPAQPAFRPQPVNFQPIVNKVAPVVKQAFQARNVPITTFAPQLQVFNSVAPKISPQQILNTGAKAVDTFTGGKGYEQLASGNFKGFKNDLINGNAQFRQNQNLLDSYMIKRAKGIAPNAQEIAANKQWSQNLTQTAMGTIGGPETTFSKAQLQLVRDGFTPEVRDMVGRFAQIVEKNQNAGRKELGPLGDYVQTLAESVFGKKAATLNNRQLLNAFDAIQHEASKVKPGKISIGLGTKQLEHSVPQAGLYNTVYRGSKGTEINKGLTSGVWVSPSRDFASEYGSVITEHQIPRNAKLLDTQSPEGMAIAKKLKTDPDILWYNPSERLVNEVKKAGYDGFMNDTDLEGNSIFIAKPEILKSRVAEQPISDASGVSKVLADVPQEKPQLPPTQGLQGEPVAPLVNPQDKMATQSRDSSAGIIPQSTQEYINKLTQEQQKARNIESGGIRQHASSFLADVKRKLVDSTAPIEDILSSAQKQGKFEILPSKNIHYQIDKVLRSRELAGQFLKDNGLVDVIKDVPDLNALNQYLIAKHAPEVAQAGFETGRSAEADAQLVHDLAPTYEPYAQKVIKFGQSLLDKSTADGLISKEVADGLKKKYPNYVPLNRIFNELEKSVVPEGVGKGVASLSKQTVIKRLQGSERAVQNPIESLLTKTLDVFDQGERNVAGNMLASYRDLPGNPFQLRELKAGESAPHTISYLENGVKKTFATTPEIAQAAKFLDKRQLGLIGNIFATPVRIARVGITGVNIPFIAANVAKDQVSATINSSHALETSILGGGGQNFIKSLWSAVGHGKGYDEWIRSAAGGTSYDISRSAPNVSVNQIRAGRNATSKIAYTVTHPGQILRAVENAVSRGEELTRIQQYNGTKNALLKQGRTPKDAEILAAATSRENTVNFSRSGDWGKALNSVFLYMNSGIQGSRTLVRNLQTRPAQTATKIGLTVFLPLATVTAWNLSDPKRKQAYDDIRDFEKENNLVIVPPNPTKDPKTGKWNVIKIPFSQEIANLTIPVRKSIEALQGGDAPGFTDVAAALLGSATSLNTQSSNALVGQFIPQGVKPPLEAVLNKNLFTGQDIVPQYINGSASKDLPPELQARYDTSGTARIIGKGLGVSPMKVEQFIKSTAGGVGSQVINASDNALNAVGAIPKEQVGGQSISEGIAQRFTAGSGGQLMDKVYNDSTKVQTIETQARKLLEAGDRQGALQLIQANKQLLQNAQTINAYRSQVDTLNGYKNKVRADNNLTPEQKDKVLQLIQQRLDAISVQYSQIK